MNESGDIERAVAAGCDDFLSKPVNKLELLKRVDNMLKLRHVTMNWSGCATTRQHGRRRRPSPRLAPPPAKLLDSREGQGSELQGDVCEKTLNPEP